MVHIQLECALAQSERTARAHCARTTPTWQSGQLQEQPPGKRIELSRAISRCVSAKSSSARSSRMYGLRPVAVTNRAPCCTIQRSAAWAAAAGVSDVTLAPCRAAL
jgi:hypothetical protein